MPYINTTCGFCGKPLKAYQRPNRPKQKKWYCNKYHHLKSGDIWGNTTRKNLIKSGAYIKKRNEIKRKQISEYGKKSIDNPT